MPDVRYLIFSDIHSNLEALSAVLADASGDYDQIINCGDCVGYGPDPNAVVEWCREYTGLVVRGNHDVTCANLENLGWFNPIAAKSAQWTHDTLTPENLAWLRDLPPGPIFVDDIEIVHGSPIHEDEYLVNSTEIAEAAKHTQRSIAFFGHTHVQGCYVVYKDQVKRLGIQTVDIDPDTTYMVNPGSVGQPRDRDPKAAYVVYDSGKHTIEMRRVEYDYQTTQRKIIELGLPDMLAHRLAVGK